MKLYHGTSAAKLEAILEGGLLPRGKRAGNFSHSVKSCRDAVYLTNTYPVYYAACAAGEDGHGAIVEVETDALWDGMLNADEDALEQVGRGRDGLPENWDMKRRTRYYRDRLVKMRWSWEESLKAMGTCCYLAAIRPSAITRAVSIDFNRQPHLLLAAINASITTLNFRFCSTEHRRMTNWVFGDPLEDPSPWLVSFGDPAYMQQGRDGISFVLGESDGRDDVSSFVSGG